MKKKKKDNFDVILTCNYSPWSSHTGGGQKSTHMVATEMANSGLKVCVIYSKSIFESVNVPEVNYHIKWAFFFAIKPGVGSYFRVLNGLSFYWVALRYSTSTTILHSNGEEGMLFGLIKKKKKFIYTNRFPYFPEYLGRINWNSPFSWLKVLFKEKRFFAMAVAMKWADVITCTSKYSAQNLAHSFNKIINDIHVVYNGIDPEFLNQELPNFDNQKGILFFGRLAKSKGVDILVEAFKLLDKKIKEKHKLTIIGQGPLEKSLIESAQLENIEIMGWMDSDDLITKIKAVKVVVLPSLEESFGNTMIETLVLGQRLITTEVGALKEVLGSYATRLRNLSVESLVDEIKGIISQKKSLVNLKQKQKKFFVDNYSWEKTCSKFQSLYVH